MDEPISPDAFRETFADTADQLADRTTNAVAKETAKRGLKKMQTADRVWVVLGVGGALFLRDRHQRKKIKALKSLATTLNLENEFLTVFVNGLLDPTTKKAEFLRELGGKFQHIKAGK